MPRAAANPLDRPVSSLAKVHPNTVRALATLGVRTVRDLVLHFPSRHEQMGASGADAAVAGAMQTFVGTVVRAAFRKAFKRGLSMVEASVDTVDGPRRLVWFNQPYVIKRLVPGAAFRFTGKLAAGRGGLRVVNSFMEPATLGTSGPVAGASVYGDAAYVPVYASTVGLSQHSLRRLVATARPLMATLPDPLPPELREKYHLLPYATAVEHVHFPSDLAEAEAARHRLGFDEVLALQLALGRLRARRQSVLAPAIPFPEEATKAFVADLPFALTEDQRRAAWEVVQDLGRDVPMQRLLNGDVGTGKTAVAAVAAFVAARAGWQTAVMAPTDILARQHALTLGRLFAGTGIRVALWTSAYKGEGQDTQGTMAEEVAGLRLVRGKEAVEELRGEIASGQISIIVGTHALVQPEFSFGRLGLAVVDEQHRFGVATRQSLLDRAALPGGVAPHLLSMTATPIPRSLALTMYGDLDVSVLRQRPKDRPPVATCVVLPGKESPAWAKVRAELAAGRQAYVVCPLVESVEGKEDASVDETARRLAKAELKGFRVGELHGQLRPADKESSMAKFAAGETQALVCTTVVEVGVDVPNATVMWIEGAERFGLSQLHQLRGRVGRGAHVATCYLAPRTVGEASRKRLRAMEEVSDGFALAEHDLALRGHGDLLGEVQSGLPTFRVASVADVDLAADARAAAKLILEGDPELRQYPFLRKMVDGLAAEAHGE
jgi:ATP-dependent DNA helicase RecG